MIDGDEFEYNGNRFHLALPFDDVQDAPWEREDRHGPVTEAPRRANQHGYTSKAPGQRYLGEHWLYDFAEAVRIAKRDGWRAPGDEAHIAGDSAKAGWLAHRAAEADFKRLSDWCNGRWRYVACVVTLLDDDGDPTDEAASLWGIESDAGDYLEEVARIAFDEVTTNLKAATSA